MTILALLGGGGDTQLVVAVGVGVFLVFSEVEVQNGVNWGEVLDGHFEVGGVAEGDVPEVEGFLHDVDVGYYGLNCEEKS